MKRLLISFRDHDAERAIDAGKKTGMSAQAYIRQAALNRLDGIDAAGAVRVELATATDLQRQVLAKAIEELFELIVATRNELEQQNSELVNQIHAAIGIDPRNAHPKPASVADGSKPLTDIFK